MRTFVMIKHPISSRPTADTIQNKHSHSYPCVALLFSKLVSSSLTHSYASFLTVMTRMVLFLIRWVLENLPLSFPATINPSFLYVLKYSSIYLLCPSFIAWPSASRKLFGLKFIYRPLSVSINNGTPVKVVSTILSHSTTQITQDIYQHVFDLIPHFLHGFLLWKLMCLIEPLSL